MFANSSNNMDHHGQNVYYAVVDKKSMSKFLCYTRRKSGTFRLCITDSSTVYGIDFTEETLSLCRKRLSLKSTEDYLRKLRYACSTGSLSVSVEDSGAELHMQGSSSGDVSLCLPRLEDWEAREEVKDLLFRMAADINTHKTGPTVSPMKRRSTEFEPRTQKTGPHVNSKKRLAGHSLINPGTKKKSAATGVDFDDEDDDY